MNRQTGLNDLDEVAHIRQSVRDILLTPIGSRIQRRDYGSRLFELIDQPISHALALQISAASVMALKKWEPRLLVHRFAVQFEVENPSSMTATLEGITTDGQAAVTDQLTLR